MGIVKSGICGTCVWEIDSEWTLTISPADGKNGVLCSEDSRCWPWRPYFCAKKIVIKEGVKTGADARSMFIGMTDCAEFDISALDVSAAEFMSNMFEDCRALTDISSLKKWDVSKVIDMSCMFCGCKSLTDISPLFEWAISSVCDRAAMFCSAGVSRKTIDAFIPMACPREGAFVGYKKCRGGRIVQLEVPEDAKRSSAYERKCRCSRAKVLNIWTPDGEEARYAVSIYNSSFVYHKGGTIEVSDFDGDRFDECAAGIHFFMTRKEAEDYVW